MKHHEGFLKITDDAKSRVRETDVAQTLERMKAGARLVDVREDNEWERGHARGAEHMGRGVIERDIEPAIPDPAAELILYCGGGYRSALAADNLQRMGYTNVYSLAGGWKAWKEAGAPFDGEGAERGRGGGPSRRVLIVSRRARRIIAAEAGKPSSKSRASTSPRTNSFDSASQRSLDMNPAAAAPRHAPAHVF